jgi:bifunctional non-homologous end joining protein LigD
MLVSGDPIDMSITWVRPEIVIEVQYTAWSGAGRVRHPVYLGTREDPARGRRRVGAVEQGSNAGAIGRRVLARPPS